MTAEKTKEIRKTLKAEHGYTARQVSVRPPHWGSIVVTVKDPAVDFNAVHRVAHEQEHVRRCEISGDILRGGNTFVDVKWDEAVLKQFQETYLQQLEDLEPTGMQYVEINGWQVQKEVHGQVNVHRTDSDENDAVEAYGAVTNRRGFHHGAYSAARWMGEIEQAPTQTGRQAWCYFLKRYEDGLA
jgi:hypothetical protein